MVDLLVTVADKHLEATWLDRNPETRAAIEAALPIEGHASRWGDELYFTTPVDVPAEEARATVPVGSVAYWPQGNAICIFWGPTPASTDERPRAASPVNEVARLADVGPLEELDGDASVRLERG